MTESANNNCDIQLPGYKLEKLLGSGGYGEVWLAHAPGGLTKAVKFIFGYHNEKRAESELKSLEKIKAVRHPFLLSLERIEVLEGRLVIVTELADGSLKDRFDHFHHNGESGIPREELLGYLRDSADALDYLSDQHSLQHLDVKPENLLLLAGHVKVADFGLVKEIKETQASLVGGMTPLYSAPEVFQGSPTSFSDQYSLAVLYQEMLTGKLPFNGSTNAELTLQHMHDEPNLDPLPMGERYVVARALSKDPRQRYASCREFVKALLDVDQDEKVGESVWTSRSTVELSTSTAAPNDRRKSRPGAMTQVFDDDLINDPAEVSDSMLIDLPPAELQESTQLPTMELTTADFRPTPTLVIGVGGTAGYVLSQLRSRVSKQFGAGNKVPSLQLLLLDTDKRALLETTHGSSEAGLTSEETLALQLRRPQEYREQSKRLLGWLSRRWLYNIPKSLLTEGLRPLGRLAFADHARRTVQRIRLALSHAMDENSLEQSAEQTGFSFDGQAVRVYVVASISGGSGSGMSIDLGYAIKSLLEKLGIENASTTGIFMHSTGRDSRYCDLARVNAFSWLKEYNHFARPEGSYPGDESSGLPAMESGTTAFDNTYLVRLGEGLTQEDLKERAESVAEYLMLDTLTPAQRFLDATREALPPTVSGLPTLRTFGIHEESAVSEQALELVIQQLCERVVLGWSGADLEGSNADNATTGNSAHEQKPQSVSDTSQLVCGAPQAIAQLQLNLEGISANARAILENQFGADVETFLSGLLKESAQDSKLRDPQGVINLIDTLFVAPPESDVSSKDYVFGRKIESIVSPLGMKLASDLQGWLLHRLDDGQERLSGTRHAAEWFAKHFQRVESDTRRLSQGIGNKLIALVNKYNSSDPSTPKVKVSEEQALALAVKYFRLRLDLRALQATSHLVRTLQSELKSAEEAIVEFGRHLRHLADKLSASEDGDARSPGGNNISHDQLSLSLLTDMPGLALRVDQQLQDQFIGPQGGLFQTVMGNRKVIGALLDTLYAIAKQHVDAAARDLTMTSEQTFDHDTLTQFAEQARPSLLNLGGIGNQLVVTPQNVEDQSLQTTVREIMGPQTSLLSGVCGNPVVCNEVGQLPMMRVAVDLIECRRDYAEFADRVHTRSDISWSPIINVQQSAEVDSAEYFATEVL